MKGGHNRKPTALRRAEGNPGKRKLPEPARVGEFGAPRCPAHLPRSAREAWKEIVPPLAEMGALRTVDVFALESVCVQIALMREAAAELARAKSLAVPATRGRLVPHPALKVFNDAQREVRAWSERFGLDSRARTQLGLGASAGPSFDDFQAQILQFNPRRTHD